MGIFAGGAESHELGRVGISAGPEAWSSDVRHAESTGGEGFFTLDYRIGPSRPDGGRGFPIGRDEFMTRPNNVRMGDNELLWDWIPSMDPEPEEPPAEPEIEPIVLGAPVSEGYAVGREGYRAALLAVEEINAKGGVSIGGVKRPFELKVIDTRDSRETKYCFRCFEKINKNSPFFKIRKFAR